MKHLLILLCLCSTSGFSIGQNILFPKWQFSCNLGLQANDKRLFGFPGKKNLTDSQRKLFGTYQFGIAVTKNILEKQKFTLQGGLGLSLELSTFLRPFNHLYNKSVGNQLLHYTDRYYKYLLQFPIDLEHNLNNRLVFVLEVLPQFSYLTVIDNSEAHYKDFDNSEWRFQPHSLEFNPGILFKFSKFNVGLKTRMFQIKKIDKIIFNSIIRDPRIDQKFEIHNPLKFCISLVYNI